MLHGKAYNREAALQYAHRWATGRNPVYYNFTGQGGDCTNFISQCIYAGSGVMNHTPDVGWYYYSPSRRAAAWSSVEYLHRFLTTNKGAGPRAVQVGLAEALAGDVIQLSADGKRWYHSLLVVQGSPTGDTDEILVATHTIDSDNRPLSSYSYGHARPLHITGVWYWR